MRDDVLEQVCGAFGCRRKQKAKKGSAVGANHQAAAKITVTNI